MAKTTKKETAPKEKAAQGKKDAKKAKEELSGLQRLVQYFKDSWAEFKKVQWPTPRQAANESIVVLVTVIFVIGLVNFYDLISNYLLSFILQK